MRATGGTGVRHVSAARMLLVLALVLAGPIALLVLLSWATGLPSSCVGAPRPVARSLAVVGGLAVVAGLFAAVASRRFSHRLALPIGLAVAVGSAAATGFVIQLAWVGACRD